MPWSGWAGDSRQKAAERLKLAQAGDPEAARLLLVAASPGGWRPDQRNAAIEAWNAYSPGTERDLPYMKNPHKGFLGGLGSVLKIAAPFAGLIPGVGPLVGAGLAAGGSALGGAMHGDRFSLLDTALAGGAGYLGGKWNPLGSRAGAAGMIPSSAGNATQGMGGAGSALSEVGNANVGAIPGLGYQSWPGLPPMGTDPGMSAGGQVGGGILDRVLGRGGGGGGGGWLDKILQYGPMIAGGISNANRQHEADQMMQDAIRGAQSEWTARAPLRDFAMQGIMGLPGLKRPDLSAVFRDEGNPYYTPYQRAG